jgi:lipoprotein signal peptidase
MPERTYHVLLWSLALAGLAADQASKYGVFSWLRPAEREVAGDDSPQHRAYALFQSKPEPRAFNVLHGDDYSRRGFYLAPSYRKPETVKLDEAPASVLEAARKEMPGVAFVSVMRAGVKAEEEDTYYLEGRDFTTGQAHVVEVNGRREVVERDRMPDYVRNDSWRYAPMGGYVPHVNHGALFGMMQEREEAANRVFAVISFLAGCAIVYWSRQKNTAKDRWLCVSLGLILGGTLGNFYDRIVFGGVRDFLHWNYLYEGYNGWPVFNLADCCLVVGACLLLLQAFFVPASQPSPQESKQAELAQATTQG